jgi:hypothetical protein
MIIDTFYKLSFEEPSYIFLAKRYGWKEDNELSAIAYCQNWFQKQVIEARLSDELYQSSLKELQDLNAKLQEEVKSSVSAGVTRIEVNSVV